MTANAPLIETLKKSDLFAEYERAFGETTGMPVALRPVETWQLPFRGKGHENSFCALMASRSKCCAHCLQMQEQLARRANDGPAIMTCDFGLREAAVPVQLGTETVGFLQTGQVLRHQPTDAQLEAVLRRVEGAGAELDRQQVKAAYLKSPVVSDKKMDSVTRLLCIFAEHLAIKSNQLAVQTANSEPAMITRAKEYIQSHHTEPLSLASVASAVHVSTFHLCKTIKKVTGISFTEHISRVRTEKAKNLLLNPNLRISEIAYEVGFQSLTHFNRVFHKIVGRSPREYRARLPRVNGTLGLHAPRRRRSFRIKAPLRAPSLAAPQRAGIPEATLAAAGGPSPNGSCVRA